MVTSSRDSTFQGIDVFPFFRSLPGSTKERIAQEGQKYQLTRGTMIYEALGREGRVYFLQKGRVYLCRISPATGKRIIFSVMEPGELFGDVYFLEGSRSTQEDLYAEAASAVEFFVLPKGRFLEILDSNKEAVLGLVASLGKRLQRAEERISSFALLSIEHRLVEELIRISRDRGEVEKDAFYIRTHISHQELADLTGVARETVTRSMAELRRKGCIEVDANQHVTIPNRCSNCWHDECCPIIT